MKYIRPRALALLTALMLLAASQANALVLSYTGFFPGESSFRPTDWSDGREFISIPKFDVTGATLNSVSIIVTATVRIGGVITNNGSSQVNLRDFSAEVAVWALPLGYAGPFDETSLDQALVVARPAVSTTAVGRVAGGTSRRFATASSSATSGVATLTNGLGGFMGSGNADIFFATDSFVGARVSGSNFVLELITEASVSMTVTYDYDSPSLLSFSVVALRAVTATTPPVTVISVTGGLGGNSVPASPSVVFAGQHAAVDVPEPAALLVFAAGLAGLGITRRLDWLGRH